VTSLRPPPAYQLKPMATTPAPSQVARTLQYWAIM
jgi:hypothetical protein